MKTWGKVIIGLTIAAGLAFIIVMVAVSLKSLSYDEIGLAYDTINKDLDNTTQWEGLHVGPPGFQFIIFPSVFKPLTFNGVECINSDGVIITLDAWYQYKAQPANLYYIVMNFTNHDGYVSILKYTGESALHEACSYFNITQFETERDAFLDLVHNKITERYENLHANITDLQVNITRPYEYENSLLSIEQAKLDIQVAYDERKRRLNEARRKVNPVYRHERPTKTPGSMTPKQMRRHKPHRRPKN